MSKWSLLRSSLVERKRDCESSSSIHRFSGYNLSTRRKIPWLGFRIEFAADDVKLTPEYILLKCYKFMEKVDSRECIALINVATSDFEAITGSLLNHHNVRKGCTVGAGVEFYIKYNGELAISLPRCDYWCYSFDSVVSGQLALLKLYTREKPKDSGLDVRGLLSNKIHGVDNTGNVCVWPAEPLLLHTLLNVPQFTTMVRDKRVLEIGGGTTALAGLGLAATGLCNYVAVTDGHPDCVKNQAVCIQMCRQQLECAAATSQSELNGSTVDDYGARQGVDMDISSSLLHWSPSVNTEQIATLTQDHSRKFDVVIASDCLFFKDFHADLVNTLQLVLAPGGVGIFLQPTRDRTLHKFVSVCAETGAFDTEIIEDYSPAVSALRLEYLEKKATLGYEEDIHYPVMLILKKK